MEAKLQKETTKILTNINDLTIKQDVLQATIDDLQSALWRLSNKFGLESSKRDPTLVPSAVPT